VRTLLRIIPILLVATIATDADALRDQPRPNWFFGVGFGVGTGSFENKNFTGDDGTIRETSYEDGVAPQIRLGRMFGQHFSVGAYWESWLIEGGVASIPDVKFRRSLQNLALGLTWYPGNPENATGGIFLRAGAGMGWSGTGAKEAIEGEAQHKGERLDEWGKAVFGEAGYEFWVWNDVTVGLAATYNYFNIEADFVQTAQFAAFVFHINRYF
jgi:hypothetical protein